MCQAASGIIGLWFSVLFQYLSLFIGTSLSVFTVCSPPFQRTGFIFTENSHPIDSLELLFYRLLHDVPGQ